MEACCCAIASLALRCHEAMLGTLHKPQRPPRAVRGAQGEGGAGGAGWARVAEARSERRKERRKESVAVFVLKRGEEGTKVS